jgi:hypothetical protein
MILTTLFEQIESNTFAARVNIASGFRVFRRAMAEDENINALISYTMQYPNQGQDVYQRLVSLLTAHDNPQYMHRYDSAVAGYLYALSITHPSLAISAAQQVIQTPKLWWALKTAKYLLDILPKTETKRLSWTIISTPEVIFSSQDKAISYAIRLAKLQPIPGRLTVETGTGTENVTFGSVENTDYGTNKSSFWKLERLGV